MPNRPPAMILGTGPFRAEHIPAAKCNYELDDGNAVLCLPTLPRGGRAQLNGGLIIRTDPGVESAGVEVGVVLTPNTLRAPDIWVLAGPESDGWATTAPPLAIEYADRGQDEPDLQRKIAQLLEGGTRAVWVVRIGKMACVEVYTPGAAAPEIFHASDTLTLPGVLQNPVPVAALFDPEQADRAALRNLLDRFGYQHPELAREEGRKAGLEQGLEQGREQGREQGLWKGREEGRLMALREAARTVLARRGEPDPEARIVGLDPEGLLRLLAEQADP